MESKEYQKFKSKERMKFTFTLLDMYQRDQTFKMNEFVSSGISVSKQYATEGGYLHYLYDVIGEPSTLLVQITTQKFKLKKLTELIQFNSKFYEQYRVFVKKKLDKAKPKKYERPLKSIKELSEHIKYDIETKPEFKKYVNDWFNCSIEPKDASKKIWNVYMINFEIMKEYFLLHRPQEPILFLEFKIKKMKSFEKNFEDE